MSPEIIINGLEVNPLTKRIRMSGIEYMPVPRCETCKHWNRDEEATAVGVCMMARGVAELNSKMWADMYDLVKTASDFGCVQWEAK